MQHAASKNQGNEDPVNAPLGSHLRTAQGVAAGDSQRLEDGKSAIHLQQKEGADGLVLHEIYEDTILEVVSKAQKFLLDNGRERPETKRKMEMLKKLWRKSIRFMNTHMNSNEMATSSSTNGGEKRKLDDAEEPSSSKRAKSTDEKNDNEGGMYFSDSDDDNDDNLDDVELLDEDLEEPETTNHMVCVFDKVTKKKSGKTFQASFKNAILRVGHREFVIKDATGNFKF
mmetsp:Transcript_28405/g.45689  ORF Transcript_28405/g.45689 Transcript_28405/m.45689 type:complete len:228 (-) Transcript_28405:262-945(-)